MDNLLGGVSLLYVIVTRGIFTSIRLNMEGNNLSLMWIFMRNNTVIVRYGEITLKSPRVRRRMERALIRSIKWRIERKGLHLKDIRKEGGRVIIYTKEPEKVAYELGKVFGVVSSSPAIEVANDLESISDVVIRVAKRELKNGVSFAIRARRLKSYPITSKDIERILGELVLNKTGMKLKVDLEHPDKIIYVEVRSKKAYIFTKIVRGVGGLPYAVEGKVVSLFSGGVDSALASWMMMKRGCDVVPIHCDMGPFYSERAKKRVQEALQWLRDWVPKEKWKIYIVPLGEAHILTQHVIEDRYRCLLCKILMYKIAESIAIKERASAIITGESLGQVASQTLDNLYFLSNWIKIPIHRPLIGFDKEEIIKKAREIGLYDAVCVDVGTCKLAPKHPETHAKDYLRSIFEDIDIDGIIKKILEKIRIMIL